MNAPAFNRRQFTAGLGALVVGFSLDPKLALGQEPPRLPGSLQGNRKLDGWIRINADGTAVVFTGKVELGQGILTALDRKSTRLNSSHLGISYAVFCLKKKRKNRST